MSVPEESKYLKSSSIQAAIRPTIKTSKLLLQDAGKLLQFQPNPTDTLPRQAQSISSTLAVSASTRILLDHKNTSLRRQYDRWENILDSLSSNDDPIVVKNERRIFVVMNNDPGGLSAVLEDIDSTICKLESLEKECTSQLEQMARIDPSIENLLPRETHPTQTIITSHCPPLTLPKMELPTFRGERFGWFQFWNLFEVAVDQQPNLPDVQKLAYLFSCLQDEAKATVAGYSLSADYYQAVVHTLKTIYGSKEDLGRRLQTELRHLSNPAHNATDLLNYHNEVTRILHQMKLCGLDIDNDHVLFDVEDHLP